MASDTNQDIRRTRVAELKAKLSARSDKCYKESNAAIKAEISRLEQVIADVDTYGVTPNVQSVL